MTTTAREDAGAMLGATLAALLGACAVLALSGAATEPLRAILTAAYHLQSRLPAGLAKPFRLLVTLLFHAIPAIDPAEDPYLTEYAPPTVSKKYDHDAAGKQGVLITGTTGLVGLHLVDHLLRTTDRHLYCLVRAKSAGKLERDAAKYKLELPGFASRVTLLDGDCRRADLGLSSETWAKLGKGVGMCFHLAANSSFVATYEILRGDWMPSYVRLLEFCAAHGVAFHLVGSVGRFAVAAKVNRRRRGVWTSGYMRQKFVQHALLEKFRERGLTSCWIDCAYILGTLASGGINPGAFSLLTRRAQSCVGTLAPTAAQPPPPSAPPTPHPPSPRRIP